MYKQTLLFGLIKEKLPINSALVNEISDSLGISTDAAYRRIRGDSPVSFEEAAKLCSHFNISMDSVVDISNKNHIRCRYSPLNLEETDSYLNFVQNILNNIERVRTAPESKIILSAIDIPQFNILAHKELALFKLFSWNKVYNCPSNYETFIKEFGNSEMFNIHEKIAKNYQLIPSTEIWTDSTIDTILRLLSYHVEVGHFNDKKFPLVICNQLSDLIDTMQKWSETGTKGTGIPYNLYISETEIGNTFLIFKNAKNTSCMVRLYTLNALSISDESFCMETENWLHKLMQRATLISGTSARERHRFFSAQRQKVETMIEKIKSGS